MRTPALLRSMVAALLGSILLATPAHADDIFTSAIAAPVVVSGPASPDNDLAPSWSFSADDGVSFECSLAREDTLVGDWAPCTSPAAYDLSTQPDGAYRFSVRGIGDNGVRGPVRTDGYALDTQAPAAPTISSAPPATGRAHSVKVGFAAEEAAQVECRIGDGDWQPCTSPHEFD